MSDLNLQLPISRVKIICKLNPQLNSISADSVKLLALAAEKYIALLGKCAGKWALANVRKTVQLCDIEQCIQKDWLFAILEDALTDWPEDNATDGERSDDEEEQKEARDANGVKTMEDGGGSAEERIEMMEKGGESGRDSAEDGDEDKTSRSDEQNG